MPVSLGGIHDLRKLANNCGRALLEFVLATAIISTLSAVVIPSYARYIESAKENVCIINRRSILYEYQLYCINEPEITLEEYISEYYPQEECDLCPSEGSYTATGSGDTAMLTCSVHRASRSASNIHLSEDY